jgi:hypothetical protein
LEYPIVNTLFSKTLNNIFQKYKETKNEMSEYEKWRTSIIEIIFKNSTLYSYSQLETMSNDTLFDKFIETLNIVKTYLLINQI